MQTTTTKPSQTITHNEHSNDDDQLPKFENHDHLLHQEVLNNLPDEIENVEGANASTAFTGFGSNLGSVTSFSDNT